MSDSPVRQNGQKKNKPSRPIYYNEAIELELLIFKREIEEKFAASRMNQTYRFPKLTEQEEKLRERQRNPPRSLK